MMTGEKIIDKEVLKKAMIMSRNQQRMREVWANVVSGPDENDPSTYIAALACLNRCSHNVLEALAGASERLEILVRFAERCVAEAEAREKEGE